MKQQIILFLSILLLLGLSCKKDNTEQIPEAQSGKYLSKIIDNNDGPSKGKPLLLFKWQNNRVVEIQDIASEQKYIFHYTTTGNVEKLVVHNLVTNAIEETISQMKYSGSLVTEYTQDQTGNSINYLVYKLTYQNSRLTKVVTEYYYRKNKELFHSDIQSYTYDANGALTQLTNGVGFKINFIKREGTKSLLDLMPIWFYTLKDHSPDSFFEVNFQGFLPQQGNLTEANAAGDIHKYSYENNADGYPKKISWVAIPINQPSKTMSYLYEY